MDITKTSRQEVAPAVYCLLQRYQPTTAAVERSFFMLNKLLAKDKNFLPKNVKRNMCVHYIETILLLFSIDCCYFSFCTVL